MGSKGGHAPNPYTQRHARTLFLRVPLIDWPRVKIGAKTEFRTIGREAESVFSANTPTPVVAYTYSPTLGHDRKLMVLDDHHEEMLFAISEHPESIAREGFESYDHFRRYWRARRKGIYRPTERVKVWRVSPIRTEDFMLLGAALVEHLYGEFAAEDTWVR